MDMLKKSFALGILLTFFTLGASAQQSIKRYCQILFFGRDSAKNLRIRIDTGGVIKYGTIQYPSIKAEIDVIKDLHSKIDIFNYLSFSGWNLVNPNPPRLGEYDNTERYVFFKEISAAK